MNPWLILYIVVVGGSCIATVVFAFLIWRIGRDIGRSKGDR